MNKLEQTMLRIAVLAVVLLAVVHFMLGRKTVEPPAIKPLSAMTAVVDPYQPKMPAWSVEASPPARLATLETMAYDAPAAHRAFGARNKQVRLLLAKLNGGGEDTEDAVERGLAYLARIQNEDGSWDEKNKMGSTGLALNAFLGAGYHHRDGLHRETVARGLDWLLSKQKPDGSLSGEQMYSAGIAGVVFAEAYGLTGDSRCQDAATRMLAFLARSQGPKGGWYYQPWTPEKGEDFNHDTSVTGWVLMAFKSAKLAGLDVPKEVIETYKNYALLVTHDADAPTEGKRKPRYRKGMAHYGIRKHKTKDGTTSMRVEERYHYTMTASTLMCRLYMGAQTHDPLIPEGLAILTTRLPQRERPRWIEKNKAMDNYLWYHAAQVGFLAGGKTWAFWNERLRKILVEHQIREGESAGAWPVAYFKWSDRSAVYPVALNIMILETYYRYFR